ncbi:hypothetical protein RF11_06524 [Thelohanellus kitauei]|uniref:Uncharacterized protein n=1 Tax=Thelohanellus kitauei TaxID=669202 RepID=A0A0C2JCW1_THEKT|nr:hypothetical protein RF11_06524 [Thelohanellus kitauei]
MAGYLLLIHDVKRYSQEMCIISQFSFVTFWPIYMVMVNLFEIMIFASFHLSITLKPFKCEDSVEGFKNKNIRCNVLDGILQHIEEKEPSVIGEPIPELTIN